jgi:hypothetical protein
MKSDPIRGKTIRWTYEDGPTAGTAFEHTFAADGRVTYRMAGAGGEGTTEKKYEVAQAGEEVWAVSYLATSGYTLTSVLDFRSRKVVSFASNEKELVVQHGTFEAEESSV